MKEQPAIDFIIAWVDGNDPNWQKRRNQIRNNGKESDNRPERYRDWDLLRYWFRGVEQFAPWVRKIHFICDQEPPGWLTENHPQLHIVRHEDYIPAEYLPTFNSHTIELNAHRIPGLSEHFVYFCDDMFLIRPMKPSDFFKDGLPRDCAGLNPIPCSDLAPGSKDKRIFYIPLNDAEYLNREFEFRNCLRIHPMKWYNPKYGSFFFRNIVFSSYNRFVGFSVFHLAQPYVKEAFIDAWKKNEDILRQTCSHAFRNDHDVSQSFIRYRQLAEGKFAPKKPVLHGAFHITGENQEITETIIGQKLPMICLNDGETDGKDFETVKKDLQNAFEQILPERSRFER